MRGLIKVYTGDGKGKTTAAFGIALRAAGAGKKVFIAQFVKGILYSEIKAIMKHLPQIEVKQYGLDCFIINQPTKEDFEAARKGLTDVETIINSSLYDLVTLDEACISLHYNLFTLDEFIRVLTSRTPSTEIVITGRYAPLGLIDLADLVTEMKEVKHYYNKGIQAREGIEY